MMMMMMMMMMIMMMIDDEDDDSGWSRPNYLCTPFDGAKPYEAR